MQIILMHHRFTQTKSLTLTYKHLMLATVLLLSVITAGTAILYFITLRFTPDVLFLRDAGATALQVEARKKDKYMKENIAVMAMKLGEMQAQIMRLDALGARVQGLAGVKPEEFNFKEKPGRGGAEPSSIVGKSARELSLPEFQQALDATARDMEHRSDYMNVVESTLMRFKIQSRMLPTVQPVNVSYNASGFGWRLDPFTGRSAFHEGIDFAAQNGTPIIAAAGGVVIAAEYHPQFGNMLEIDHGNDIVTRYAHASRPPAPGRCRHCPRPAPGR